MQKQVHFLAFHDNLMTPGIVIAQCNTVALLCLWAVDSNSHHLPCQRQRVAAGNNFHLHLPCWRAAGNNLQRFPLLCSRRRVAADNSHLFLLCSRASGNNLQRFPLLCSRQLVAADNSHLFLLCSRASGNNLQRFPLLYSRQLVAADNSHLFLLCSRVSGQLPSWEHPGDSTCRCCWVETVARAADHILSSDAHHNMEVLRADSGCRQMSINMKQRTTATSPAIIIIANALTPRTLLGRP
jgi:hypothetical protein